VVESRVTEARLGNNNSMAAARVREPLEASEGCSEASWEVAR
jgi:hypothetical protein